MERKGITLIGMPTSGKSTIGAELAKRLDWPMLDVDRWMEHHEGMPLGDVIAKKGDKYTLDLETQCLRESDLHQVIVSTPGSIIYSDAAKEPLEIQTNIFWLNVSLDEVRKRLETDPDPNRQNQIIGIKEKGLDGLYVERTPKYSAWARYVIECATKDINEITDEIINTFNQT